jgi:hypothetical protein
MTLVTTIRHNVPDIFAPADNVRIRELLAQDNLAMLARRTWERTARSGPITARQGACGDNTKGVPQSARSVMSVFSDASSLLTHRVDVSRETLVNAVISRMTTTFSSCMIRKADAKYFIIMTPQYVYACRNNIFHTLYFVPYVYSLSIYTCIAQ